ncbi:hypothetical protein CDCA_CDCA03G1142 [Cyanidium caldarium]|uniref:tRNA pseudouridine synthase n=1 Tax=Cyanidium caldarium TaxID=2771 RepID=A0AAV9IS83_CYACA|nr:hypothetical protein CDCA_CDCA03G1142 [Cyanidium caldarium]
MSSLMAQGCLPPCALPFISPLSPLHPRCRRRRPRRRDQMTLEPPPPPPQRYRAVVSYDGTRFYGFQLQKGVAHRPTIQGALERVLQRRFGFPSPPVRVTGASRTDAGVHARGQVVHFDAPPSHYARLGDANYAAELEYVLNRLLPDEVRVRALRPAPPPTWCWIRRGDPLRLQRVQRLLPWSATHSATSKQYTYRILLGAVSDPLLGRFAHHERWPLRRYDALFALMRAWQGQHDFGAFAHPAAVQEQQRIASPRGTVRCIHQSTAQVVTEFGVPDVLHLHFHLDGALRHMLRNMVGTLLAVACGRLELEEALACLHGGVAQRERLRQRIRVAPARGLCLDRVHYPDGYPGVHAAEMREAPSRLSVPVKS